MASGLIIKNEVAGCRGDFKNLQQHPSNILYDRDKIGLLQQSEFGIAYPHREIKTSFRLYQSGFTIIEVDMNDNEIVFTSLGDVWVNGVKDHTYTLPTDGTEYVLNNTLLDGTNIDGRKSTKIYDFVLPEYDTNNVFLADNNTVLITKKGEKLNA